MGSFLVYIYAFNLESYPTEGISLSKLLRQHESSMSFDMWQKTDKAHKTT